MSNLNISENLFLGEQELNRFKRFITDEGIKRSLLFCSKSFGIVKDIYTENKRFISHKDSFRLKTDGNSIFVDSGFAVDALGNVLTNLSQIPIQIPNNNLFYVVSIRYKIKQIEQGTVTINKNRKLTGDGTKFLEVLRGQPDFPVYVKFEDSKKGNVYNYEVQQVISQTEAQLIGEFVDETDLQYKVGGTFTPGYQAPSDKFYIYEYDSVEILIKQVNQNQLGNIVGDDVEFILGIVKNSNGTIVIEDRRYQWWGTDAEYDLKYLKNYTYNPIIGVETIKWDIDVTPRDRNEVTICWGYEVKQFTFDTKNNQIAVVVGAGGILKENNISQFSDGFFDGWLLYSTKTGNYTTVNNSVKNGSQILLNVDVLDTIKFKQDDTFVIVPNAEEIQIEATYPLSAGLNHVATEIFTFPILQLKGKCYVRVVDSNNPHKYNFKYRYKNYKLSSGWIQFPNDSIGYYNEYSFDQNGSLKTLLSDRQLIPYTSSYNAGFITITPNVRSFRNIIDGLVSGDLIGVEHVQLNNTNVLTKLVVGKNRQTQIFHCNRLTINADTFITLEYKRIDGSNCINGNKFIIQIEGDIRLEDNKKFVICEKYVSNADNTILFEIDQQTINFIKQNTVNKHNGLTIIFTYDGNNWTKSISNEFSAVPYGMVVAYNGNYNEFDATGLGNSANTYGWAICNGNNGTKDLRGKFILPSYIPDDLFITGGEWEKQITLENLPNILLDIKNINSRNNSFEIITNNLINYSGWNSNSWSGSSPLPEWGKDYGSAFLKAHLNGGNKKINIAPPYIVLLYIQKVI